MQIVEVDAARSRGGVADKVSRIYRVTGKRGTSERDGVCEKEEKEAGTYGNVDLGLDLEMDVMDRWRNRRTGAA